MISLYLTAYSRAPELAKIVERPRNTQRAACTTPRKPQHQSPEHTLHSLLLIQVHRRLVPLLDHSQSRCMNPTRIQVILVSRPPMTRRPISPRLLPSLPLNASFLQFGNLISQTQNVTIDRCHHPHSHILNTARTPGPTDRSTQLTTTHAL